MIKELGRLLSTVNRAITNDGTKWYLLNEHHAIVSENKSLFRLMMDLLEINNTENMIRIMEESEVSKNVLLLSRAIDLGEIWNKMSIIQGNIS